MKLGSDVEALGQFGRSLESTSSRVSALVQELDSAIAGLWWQGDAAEALASGWRHTDKPSMVAVVEDLRLAGEQIKKNVDEQRAASEGGSSVSAPANSVRAPSWQENLSESMWDSGLDPLLLGIETYGLLADGAPVVKALNYGVMVGRGPIPGLTDLGMAVNEVGSEGFNHYRGAKGGFTTALRNQPKLDVRAGVFGAALEGTLLLDTGFRHGVGSSEFAEQTIDGTLSAAAGFVPGGGLAYQAGKLAGKQIYEHTPVGGWMEAAHDANQYLDAAESAGDRAAAAVARGDFEEASRLNEQAREQAQRAQEESNGWKGLWNSLPF